MSFTSYETWVTPVEGEDGREVMATIMFSLYDSWEDRTYVLYTDGTMEEDSPSLRLLVAELEIHGETPAGTVACDFLPVSEETRRLVVGMFRTGPHPGLDRTPVHRDGGATRPGLLVDPRMA